MRRSIFKQRENPAVYGGRESRTLRDATAVICLAEPQTLSTRRDVRNIKGYVGSRHLYGNTRCAETNVLNISGRRFPRAGSATGCGVRVVRKHGKPTHWAAKYDRTAFDREVDALGERQRLKTVGDDTLGDGSIHGSATGRFRKSGGVKPAPLTLEETVLKPARHRAGFPPVWGSPVVNVSEGVTDPTQ
jgi:hypothetical protein